MLTKYQRLNASLARVKTEMRNGARIGTQVIANGAGGIAAGFIAAKMPTVPNTTLNTNALAGAGLAFAAVVGLFSEHSDHVGALAGGMVAAALAKESEAYFS